MSRLVIPVYLDTSVVLDLLASLEDGFSMVEQVRSSQGHEVGANAATGARGGGGFQVAQILELLKVELEASGSASGQLQAASERSGTRTHTYGSLFMRLLRSLDAAGHVVRPTTSTDWGQVAPSDFVELSGVFRLNPLLDGLEKLERVVDLASAYVPSAEAPKSSGSRRGKGVKSQQAERETPATQLQKMTQPLVTALRERGTDTFVVSVSGLDGHQAVCVLAPGYFREHWRPELEGGDFKILGKVVRSYTEDESYSLLKGTSVGVLGPGVKTALMGVFDAIPPEQIDLPSIQLEVSGPLLHVLPIGIYR
jgi:hypothetical protein